MGLTKYGRREWVLGTIIIGLGVTASLNLASHWWWSLIAILPLGAVWAWMLWFFRDPNRVAQGGSNVLVSPADGRVTDITPIGAASPLGVAGVKVGIFMSVFSVHVNRSPGEVQVEKVDHLAGVFLDARDPLASERNESATTYLTIEQGGRSHPLVIRQIAGLIARRIVTDLQPGQHLERGERIGMIKFGSRMEVLAPLTLRPEVLVKIGDAVRAGETAVIAMNTGDGSHG